MTPADTAKQTLQQLLDQAAIEKNREKVLQLLHEIALHMAERNVKASGLKTVTTLPTMETDTFDLFAGPPDRHAVWCESIAGIEMARRRMEELAAKSPGNYFIFHERSRAVLARVGNIPMRAVERKDFLPMVVRAAS